MAFFSFDSPQTLYSVYRATEAERHRSYVGGMPPDYPQIAPGMLARIETVGYGVAARDAHGWVRVTRGTVDVDAQWRRARQATREAMTARFAAFAAWTAGMRAAIANEEAARRAAADLRRLEAERTLEDADLADVML